MRIERLRELDLDSNADVEVITKGEYQVVDVANSIRFPAFTAVKTKLTPFVENQIRLGNLTLVGEDDAPESKGSANVDDLRYTIPEDTRMVERATGDEAPELPADREAPRRASRRSRTDSSSQGLKSEQPE